MFERLWPLTHVVPPELAHRLGLTVLRVAWSRRKLEPRWEFRWKNLRFRTRVGIAAGLDKNAVAVRGIERLGAGFIELGTILVEPWRGLPERPRIRRLRNVRGVWNRLGFPSDGVEKITARLAAFPRSERRGMLVGCNVGPHPGHVRLARSAEEYVAIASAELRHLVEMLQAHADFFVVNLSSPNTPGLTNLLLRGDLGEQIVEPIRQVLDGSDKVRRRSRPTPLFVKLPPEDPNGQEWTKSTLERVTKPLIEKGMCTGFVATNTSASLAREIAMGSEDLPGGVVSREQLTQLSFSRPAQMWWKCTVDSCMPGRVC